MTADQKPSVHIFRETNFAAVELCKAGITQANITKQLKMKDRIAENTPKHTVCLRFRGKWQSCGPSGCLTRPT